MALKLVEWFGYAPSNNKAAILILKLAKKGQGGNSNSRPSSIKSNKASQLSKTM